MKDVAIRYLPNFYNDIPIAYAVFSVELNSKKNEVKDAKFAFVNAEFTKVVGKDVEEIIGKSFLDIFPLTDSRWKNEFFKCAILRHKSHNYTFSLDLGYWVAYSGAPSLDMGYCSYVFFNIDEENKKSQELKKAFMTDDTTYRIAKLLNTDLPFDEVMHQSLKELSLALDADRVYVLETDGAYVNKPYEYCKEGFLSPIDELKRVSIAKLDKWINGIKKLQYIEIPDVEELKDKDSFLYDLLSKSGIKRSYGYPLYSEGKLIGVLCVDNYRVGNGIESLKIVEDASSFISSRLGNHLLVNRLERASKYDSLTHLLNRFGFNEDLDDFFLENKDTSFVYAVMDIDDFKAINDLYGHPAGDIALKSFAKCLNDEFLGKAIFGRTGGDEFSLILKDITIDKAEDLLESFVKKEKQYTYKGKTSPYTISLGYAVYPKDGKTLNDLYSKADSALYNVKFYSKNDLVRYNKTMLLAERQRIAFSMKDITSNIPGVLFIYQSETGRMLYANEDCVRMFDCDNVSEFMEYVDFDVKGTIYKEDYDKTIKAIWEQIDSGKTEKKDYVEYRILTKKGVLKSVRGYGRLVDDSRYGSIFYVLLVNDIEK